MGAGTRQRDEEEALLFVLMRALRLVGGREIAGAVDHAARWRTALPTIRTRKACDRQAGYVNGFELKAFAAVHRHQPHGIQMQRGGGDLAQIAFFGEQDELAHTIQRPLDRQASAHRHLLAREVQELPEGDGAHLGGEAFRLAKLLPEVRAIQQIGGEEIPGARIRAQAGQVCGQPLDALAPGC